MDEDIAVVSSMLKNWVKRKERFFKNSLSLTAITGMVTDSSDESSMSPISKNRQTHSAPLKLSMHSWPGKVAPPRFLLFVFFSQLLSLFSGTCILFVHPHFARPAARKTELQKYYMYTFGALSTLWNSSLYLYWLTQLSENPVEGVCGRGLFAKLTIFSNNFFSWSRHFKEL